ncbi:uncharacterized protein MONBRDRAFT_25157 [Monosiga brevicollis MX1]|uniref:FYVE-type domain-containing protein n=1 Tax=Monosiga brevicollis TaxID=81824 RepID=A9UYK5_MONBE|nr:uncharacterized protein MONBRDRAFT_25157 [Monosiga brevicollis MX1]EDQ89478.1 predicted protein [Monosiga brevicollis MX1]|eukprot:XP_001745507.1 hypothetical protein [Monosiga brevicollis MX1]
MAEVLLRQLSASCEELKLTHYNLNAPLTDNLRDIGIFWNLLERVLRDGSRAFRPTAVPGLNHQSTPTGRGRALLRYWLTNNRLAEVLQLACRNEAMVKRHYHTAALLRQPSSRSRVVDTLYNLNEVPCMFENKLSLDRAWPDFAARSFDATSLASVRRSSPNVTQDLNTTVSSSSTLRRSLSGASLASMQSSQPRDVPRTASSSQGEGDASSSHSWGNRSGSAILGHWQANESPNEETRATRKEMEALRRALADARKAQSASETYAAELKRKLAAVREELEDAQSSVTTPTLRGEVQAELAKEYEDQLKTLEQQLMDVRQNMSDAEADRSSMSAVQAEFQQQISSLQHQLADETQRTSSLQQSLAASEQQLQEAKHSIERLNTQLTEQEHRLKQQHQADLTEYVALLQEAERRRAEAEEGLKSMTNRHQQDKQRADLAEQRCHFLDKLVTRATEAKVSLAEKCFFLLDAAERMLSIWQPDKDAPDCNSCHKAFSVTLRRHHCRVCGQIFCHDCSNFYEQLANKKQPTRACRLCVSILKRLKEIQTETADTSGQSEDSLSRLAMGLRRPSVGPSARFQSSDSLRLLTAPPSPMVTSPPGRRRAAPSNGTFSMTSEEDTEGVTGPDASLEAAESVTNSEAVAD